ncbi:MAG: magnesium/cobalt transporter CorA [Flavobacteriaceae bacterium]|nr:magnesium/cobalt transporter CorA [Flavobacteriaceae bacterium]
MPKRKTSKYKTKVGQIPGTLTYTGGKVDSKLSIEIFDYNHDTYHEKEIKTIEDAFDFKLSDSTTWININGLNHIDVIEKLGEHYGLHSLTLEDIVNTSQRPKIDEHNDYLYVVLKMLHYDDQQNIISEQVSFILGKHYVLSFQEAEGDVFDSIRDRIRINKGRIRGLKSDYLLYLLIDALVDHYYYIIETMGEKIEGLEDQLFEGNPPNEIPIQIQALKREVLKVRRAIFPLREIVSSIEKIEHELIGNKTIHFYKDIYDHIIQVSESIDIYREMIWGLMDMYMTTISNKMNEVMKVLTIIATIFIPMTFIAGIYGMNFENMPELHYKYSYFIFWGIMLLLFAGMIFYFRKKKWL